MKRSMLAAAVAVALNAQALTGVVVDDQGRAVQGARVEVVGAKTSVITDAEGTFAFEEKNIDEIHVVAEGFGHKLIHVEGDEALRVVLVNSVIEQVDVIGLPLHASIIESSLPIAVLSGEELRKRQAATLGDSLEREVGVHTNFHGGVASTPVIRGISGPRVLITQNGLDVSDVSRVGPDHAVASEVSTAQQVEILRGPATLFFGSGAIGGVVNVVDQRVPSDTDTRGEWLVQGDSVNRQRLSSFNLNTGRGNVGLHADGFWRNSDDYEVPIAPDLDDPHNRELSVANSDEESRGFTLGGSYLADDGYIGISAGRLDRVYGIPGHSHAEEEEVDVSADLEQDRYQLISEWNFDSAFLRTVNTRAAYTDYTHAEIEAGVVGTAFSNRTHEVRLDLLHQDIADWRGGLNFHYKRSDVAAEGAEAFTPPSKSRTLAVAAMEERHFGNVLLQLGARLERVDIDAENLLLPQLEAHSHDEDNHDHDHDEDTVTRVFAVDQEFTPVSVSLGAVWDFRPGYNVGLSVSRSQRAPSASELMSFGPHIGARTYEIGALFALQHEGDESRFEVHHAAIDLETAQNLDLTFRKHEGPLGIIVNTFYNRVDNFYYQKATGVFAESGHEHQHEHVGDIHEDELPVYLFTSNDVEFVGFEAQTIWQISSRLKTTIFSDYVRAELATGEYLPRQSPRRVGFSFDYQRDNWSADLDWTRYDRQDNVAPRESATTGYNMLDAAITYHLKLFSNDLALYLKGENLTDTEARVHTSFLKDLAPKPGRNFAIGLRGTF